VLGWAVIGLLIWYSVRARQAGEAAALAAMSEPAVIDGTSSA
jgi:hypothetical protein